MWGLGKYEYMWVYQQKPKNDDLRATLGQSAYNTFLQEHLEDMTTDYQDAGIHNKWELAMDFDDQMLITKQGEEANGCDN